MLNIEKFNWMFTLKGREKLNLKLNLDYIWTKFEGFKVFFLMLRNPLLLDGGVRGFLFLRELK